MGTPQEKKKSGHSEELKNSMYKPFLDNDQ